MQRPDIPKEATHVEYFEKLAIPRINNSPMAQIDGLTKKVQFDIHGENAGKWTLVLEDGVVKEVVKGNGIIPHCTLSMSGETFMAVVRQEISPHQAFFEEKIKVGGDVMLGLKIAVLSKCL